MQSGDDLVAELPIGTVSGAFGSGFFKKYEAKGLILRGGSEAR